MTDIDQYFTRVFADVPVMGIFRSQGLDRTLALAEAAWSAGVRVVEVTVMSDDDLPVLEAVASAARRRGLDVGAGTVVDPARVAAIAAAGAAFTVAPGLDSRVAAASMEHGLPHIPGVATGTEIQSALVLGLSWLKAFPAASLGASWVKQQSGPFPHARFVATGGLTADTAESFLEAGCRAVALGSAFASQREIDAVGALLERRGARANA